MKTKSDMHRSMPMPPLPSEACRGVGILLASASPRRHELLGMIVRDFVVVSGRNVDESYPAALAPEEVPAYLSRIKADAYADMLRDNEVLITADTIVISHDGKILGKPQSRSEAMDMLGRLSARTHTVVTGVSLSSVHERDTFSETTEVSFADLTPQEIESYVDIYRPFDKAGAYGIQEWIGAVGISGIKGCYYNVMGLPLHALYRHLKNFIL